MDIRNNVEIRLGIPSQWLEIYKIFICFFSSHLPKFMKFYTHQYVLIVYVSKCSPFILFVYMHIYSFISGVTFHANDTIALKQDVALVLNICKGGAYKKSISNKSGLLLLVLAPQNMRTMHVE